MDIKGVDKRKHPNPFYKGLTPALDLVEAHYYIDEVRTFLSPTQRLVFDGWIKGRTITVVNDRGAIGKSVLDKFLRSVGKE